MVISSRLGEESKETDPRDAFIYVKTRLPEFRRLRAENPQDYQRALNNLCANRRRYLLAIIDNPNY